MKRPALQTCCCSLLLLAFANTALAIAEELLKKNQLRAAEWTSIVQLPLTDRRGDPEIAAIWLPPNVDAIRGLFYPGDVMIDRSLGTDGRVRSALAEEGLGVLSFNGVGHLARTDGANLKLALRALAEATGHPEVEFVPFLTAGHSAAGLFCRRVGYWAPERTIGIVMIKSGNFHHGIEDMTRTLRGVPLIHFSGEREEYGPEGGDLKNGLRSVYGRQTQWVMTRMQMLERRRKHEDNIWTLVVHRGGGHTQWNKDMTELFIRYMRSVVALRVPPGPPDGTRVVQCRPLTAQDGWLYDADIKNPQHAPAPYADYTGDKLLAFWAPDEATAKAIAEYHGAAPWRDPDPTELDPVEERFYPPDLLKDYIDAPAPPRMAWRGGAGTWDKDGAQWQGADRAAAWNPEYHAVFEAKPAGVVALGENITTRGLTLGDGYTLDIGKQGLHVRWHADFAPGSVVHMPVHKRSPGVKWSRFRIVGNARLAGTLVIEQLEELKPENAYGMIGVNGILEGDFDRIEAPEGCTVEWHGGTLVLTTPPTPEMIEARRRKAKEAEIQRMFSMPDEGVDGDAPDDLLNTDELGL